MTGPQERTLGAVGERDALAIAIDDARLTLHDRNRDQLLNELIRAARRIGATEIQADLESFSRQSTDRLQTKLRYTAAQLGRWSA